MKGKNNMGEARRRRMAGRTDDTAEAAAARMGIKPAQLQELRRRLQEMVSTPEGMEQFLTDSFGVGNFQYDAAEGVWVAPDFKHRGPGRRFYIFRPNGTWFDAIVPDHKMS